MRTCLGASLELLSAHQLSSASGAGPAAAGLALASAASSSAAAGPALASAASSAAVSPEASSSASSASSSCASCWHEGCRLLHLEGYTLYRPALAEQMARLAREAGALVSIDLASFEVRGAARGRGRGGGGGTGHRAQHFSSGWGALGRGRWVGGVHSIQVRDSHPFHTAPGSYVNPTRTASAPGPYFKTLYACMMHLTPPSPPTSMVKYCSRHAKCLPPPQPTTHYGLPPPHTHIRPP